MDKLNQNDILESFPKKEIAKKKLFSPIVKTIAVEGNVGCGKSTFLQYLSKNPNVEIYPESVERWRNINGINLLQLMYSNPRKYAFPFQLYATLTMLETHEKKSSKPFKIME